MAQKTRRFDPRQTMRGQDFEIFHYRDARMEPVAVHHHDFYEVYFFLGGQTRYRVEGRVYRLEPWDLLLISPMELHQPMVDPGGAPYERMVLWIGKRYLEGLSTGGDSLLRCFDSTLPTHTNLLRLTPVQRTGVWTKLRELAWEAGGEEYGGALCARGIFLQLMVELNRIALQCAGGVRRRDEPPALVAQALAYIGEHYCEPLSLDALAQRFYVSKYHLAHAFRQAVGTGVYRYIVLRRLLAARQLLEGGAAPGVAGASCGFGDYASFYRAFKAEYGVSPRAHARLPDGEQEEGEAHERGEKIGGAARL